jgi:anti-anti-sigma factor
MNGSSKIGISKAGPRTVLIPKEALTQERCEDLEATFRACLQQQDVEIVLDLTQVPFVDSAALETFLRMHDELQLRGSKLKLVGANSVCLDILVATRLIRVFSVYESLAKAIRSGP